MSTWRVFTVSSAQKRAESRHRDRARFECGVLLSRHRSQCVPSIVIFALELRETIFESKRRTPLLDFLDKFIFHLEHLRIFFKPKKIMKF